jgi:hypothetical protein
VEKKVLRAVTQSFERMRSKYPPYETLVAIARAHRAPARSPLPVEIVQKADADEEQLIDAIARLMELSDEDLEYEADTVLDTIADVAESAGRLATTELGFEDGFDWTTPEETFRTLFPELADTARDYLKDSFGKDAQDIARLIVEATDPQNPKPIDDLISDLRARVEDLARRRAEVIARTETARAWEAVTFETFERNGIRARRWLTAEDSPSAELTPVCPTCLENAAQGYVEIDEPFFSVSGDEIMHPPAHPWCRCALAADTRGWLPPRELFLGDEDELLNEELVS